MSFHIEANIEWRAELIIIEKRYLEGDWFIDFIQIQVTLRAGKAEEIICHFDDVLHARRCISCKHVQDTLAVR